LLLLPAPWVHRKEDSMTETINREELQAKIDRGDPFRLVEALPPEAYQRGHLPGAVNVPADKVAALAPRLLPDKSAEIVVYCARAT
jgi:rhodanese-related sulfurtransferase